MIVPEKMRLNKFEPVKLPTTKELILGGNALPLGTTYVDTFGIPVNGERKIDALAALHQAADAADLPEPEDD